MRDTLSIMAASAIQPMAVDARQAARLIGVSVRTLEELCRAGKLKSVQPGGRGGKRLFRVSSLERWLCELESESTTALQTARVPQTSESLRKDATQGGCVA